MGADDYDVIGEIGRGKTGVCYAAKPRNPGGGGSGGGRVVIKRILCDLDDPELAAERRDKTLREIEIMKSLSHEFIVKFFGSFGDGELDESTSPYLNIVMEICSGGNLQDHIFSSSAAGPSPVPEQKTITWFTQAVSAVEYLHSQSIIHRDMKSENLFICNESKTIKLADFGFSIRFSSSKPELREMIGSPYYLSPEICEAKPYNHKIDIWALGVILYEMCTGRRMWTAGHADNLVLKILRGKYEPIGIAYRDEVKELVSMCIVRDIGNRADAKDLLVRLRGI